MKINYFIGSPKIGISFSNRILHMIHEELDLNEDNYQGNFYNINHSLLSKEELNCIIDGDVLVLAFPLYVDGIPAHLLEQLTILESEIKEKETCSLTMYGIINCGFIEAKQCRYAAKMLEFFCEKSGIQLGQILCVGGGEMMQGFWNAGLKFGQGPLATLDRTFSSFLANIRAKNSGETLYMQAKMPAFFFRFMSAHTFWNQHAKNNGLTVKDLKRRIQLPD